ncbi:deoxycytidylate deaminase [Bradyrhizobium elkanii]|uniref:deoxycytidylate deaminase n=1 Tax=Bradyrhizobium elkanii TaxID=29448 RepID=UPI00271505A5|nr:hypothetical protein [Bradyrhizobium elkanii]WLB77042.1 hypothetical protein QIH83_21745 [Bradyrhizobium elkanii]
MFPGSRPQVTPAFPDVSAFLRDSGLVSIADSLATRVANSGLAAWLKTFLQTDPDLELARLKQERWDRYFLKVAQAVSTASKDPSTKVGAVIVRPDRTMASFGYNGFPRGIADTDERLNNREVKYDLVVHGEINAILTAREPLHGYANAPPMSPAWKPPLRTDPATVRMDAANAARDRSAAARC